MKLRHFPTPFETNYKTAGGFVKAYVLLTVPIILRAAAWNYTPFANPGIETPKRTQNEGIST